MRQPPFAQQILMDRILKICKWLDQLKIKFFALVLSTDPSNIKKKYQRFMNSIKTQSFQNQLIYFSLMSIARKYQDYLKEFPINIEWRITLTKDLEGFVRDNTTYFGPMIGSMKNGNYGISFQKKSNGTLIIREGSWSQDKMNGKGSAYYIPEPLKKEPFTIVWKEGQWSEDNLNGKGVIRTYNTSDKIWRMMYVGTFSNNFKSGFGLYYFNNMKYEGEFDNDCFQGQGRLTKSENQFYSGTFKNGRPFGKGVERRGKEVIVYEENNSEKTFIIPENEALLPQFYQSIISQI